MSNIKSVYAQTEITVLGKKDGTDVPIKISVVALELNYGPVIDLSITCDVPYYETGFVDWVDHPLMWAKNVEKGTRVENIIDNTPAVRALIDELVGDEKALYTTTNCSHKGRLIRALMSFWS